jgi:peroxiredoxin
MTTITVLGDPTTGAETATVDAALVEGRALVAVTDLPVAIGWTLKPEGLCRGDVCVPVRDRSALGPVDDGTVDLLSVAAALGRPALLDEPSATLAVGAPSDLRRQALAGRQAPPVELPDLDGNLRSISDLHDDKAVVVAFSTWCGCAYDLPGWQALRDELADEGLDVVAVALDEDPEAVRPFAEGLDIPVLVDREHVLSELYAISNVPTVVWLDERDRIARPNGVAFGSDTFRDFTGVDSEPHKDAIREWVRSGSVDVEVDAEQAVGDLSEDELAARLRFRIGAELRRRGDAEGAERNLAAAVELAPHDWTVRRAAMPLRGMNPFGDEFFEMAQEWEDAGRPYHGLPANHSVDGDAPTEGAWRPGD